MYIQTLDNLRVPRLTNIGTLLFVAVVDVTTCLSHALPLTVLHYCVAHGISRLLSAVDNIALAAPGHLDYPQHLRSLA